MQLLRLSKKVFDNLVDGGASSPATTTPTSFCLNCKQFRSQNLQGSDLVHSKHKQTIPTGMDRLCLFNYNKRAMDDVWRLGLRIRKEKQSAILLL